jgi:hypothetical protein
MMNKDQAAKMLPIIKQIAEGKTIQKRIGGEWVSLAYVEFFIDADNYRIKPELKTAWYRVAEMRGSPHAKTPIYNVTTVSTERDERWLTGNDGFIKWLSARVIYEVTE